VDLGEISLKERVIEGELVELEPQPNVLTAGFDEYWAHNPSKLKANALQAVKLIC